MDDHSWLDAEPLIFKTKQEYDKYVDDPLYESSKDFPGLCWAVHIDENISQGKNQTEQRLFVDFYVEAQDGRIATHSGGKPKERATT